MEYTQEQINKRFEELPDDIREAITSVETSDELQNISNKHGLMLDQTTELMDETGLRLLGLTPSNKFIYNLEKRLKITNEKATDIAEDISSIVFQKIKESLQETQEEGSNENDDYDEQIHNINDTEPKQKSAGIINLTETQTPNTPIDKANDRIGVPSYIPKPQDIKKTQDIPTYQNPKPIADIEKVGQFTIENKTVTSSNQYKEENINKESILKQIEGDSYKPPMIDHLLNTPVINKEQVVKKEKMVEEEGSKNVVENKEVNKYPLDPYREQI